MRKPVRQDAIAQELRAMEDRKKEDVNIDTQKSISPYWIIAVFFTSLALAIYLL